MEKILAVLYKRDGSVKPARDAGSLFGKIFIEKNYWEIVAYKIYITNLSSCTSS